MREDFNYYGDWADRRAVVTFHLTLFHQYRTRRVNFETMWEEAAAIAAPEFMGSFTYGREIAPGAKRQQYQIDSTMAVAGMRFKVIAGWLLTPQNLLWSKVTCSDPYVKKQPGVKQYYAEVTRTLWCERYKWEANFVSQNDMNMCGLGHFGNMGMYTDAYDTYLDPKERGLRYLSTPVGEIYIVQDHQRKVVGFVRHFRLNAQQAVTKFPKAAMPIVEAALKIGSQQMFDFLHFVKPRTDFDPTAWLSPRGKKYQSFYIAIQDYELIEEKGYRTLPLAYGRFMQFPEEDYGRGPAQIVQNAGKTLNAEKRVFLKQGHRAGDPAYIVADIGLTDLKTHSGAWNAGLMTRDGKPLIQTLPAGEIQITKEMMQDEKDLINSAYLVDLFKLILEDPGAMGNPRQVIEYVNERGIILFPTLGRQCAEYLGPLIDRELDILSGLRKLPKMPQVLKEAHGEYEVEYTNPLALAMRGPQIAGYVRTMEFAAEAIKSGADPSIFDRFDLDEAIPEMGDWNMSPENWFSNDKKIAASRQARAQAQAQEQKAKMMPAQAAIIKAQAIAQKAQAGQNIGGTLSGVPQEQMPQIPGG
jgi:hypothetical protein